MPSLVGSRNASQAAGVAEAMPCAEPPQRGGKMAKSQRAVPGSGAGAVSTLVDRAMDGISAARVADPGERLFLYAGVAGDHRVPLNEVLRRQAYLLFYERIS